MPFCPLGAAGSLYYRVSGLGAPLVLIGGLGMPHQGWAMQAQFLSKGLQLIRFDNRGCGASTTPSSPLTIEAMAGDVVALLDHLHIEDAHIMGLSMGGFIALALASLAPQRVRSLVLAHTCAALPPRTKHRLRLWQDMRRANVPVSLVAREQLLWIFPESILQHADTVDHLASGLAQVIAGQSAEGFGRQVEACEAFDMVEALPKITSPTLVIAGEDDLSAPLPHAQQLKNMANVLKFTVFASAGHASHVLCSEAFNREVAEFIQLVEQKAG